MKNFFYIIFLVYCLSGCTSNTIFKKPENLIPKNQMVDLLTDMYLANSGYSIKNINLKRNIDYFPLVFEKYHIDSVRFKESNFYYTSKIDDYDEILGEVKSRLELLKKDLDHQIKIQDSIDGIKKGTLKKFPGDLKKFKKK